ncbi:hypothetical protein OG785_01385 [Streptomyces sp. NBC_00006]|uniref:hypothetical protein n=1 Tax=unclassified Streptomyces TaxID=2593676 RepID=UPI002259BDDC|nr:MULTISPECIES: hypothetical protein [unclassified Streptomyces]MCX4834905.1 hypothetical protein [Streptomyces sp. NBC_01016]MCX5529227.1 hypothetical protein [Streptomyces sp. NBC_00006]
MGDGFRSSPETLKAEGQSFSDIGREFYQATARLKNGLAAQGDGGGGGGEAPKDTSFASVAQDAWKGMTTFSDKAGTPPWGDDELGEKFGVVYEGLRDGMTDSMEHLATKLNEIGKALERMAKNHEENEDFNEALVKEQTPENQFGGEVHVLKSVSK